MPTKKISRCRRSTSIVKITCKHCGAVHEVRELRVPFRDDGKISCVACSQTLLAWNGGVMYMSAKLKS